MRRPKSGNAPCWPPLLASLWRGFEAASLRGNGVRHCVGQLSCRPQTRRTAPELPVRAHPHYTLCSCASTEARGTITFALGAR